MSISSALSNAYSGLTAVSRSAETISNNVSNALTEGYSRQEVSYTANVLNGRGAGVRTSGTLRNVDVQLTTARRQAEASMANKSTVATATTKLANTLGLPGDATALATRMTSLESSLRSAITAPDSSSLQNGVLMTAKNLAGAFNLISTETTRLRVNADATIAREIATVNTSLKKIEGLNAEIRMLTMTGRSSASLEDQRQVLVDTVNAIIPIRASQVDHGEIALFTSGGEILLNGSPRELAFSRTSMMTPTMTLASGALSGLTLAGKPITIGQPDGTMEGGSLAANFQIRDDIAPKFHSQLDALARDLIERFQSPAVDPTLGVGDAGLFTDAGSPFSVINESGIAARIGINALVDPSEGGDLWKLREGLGAVAPGYAGNSAHFERLSNSLGSLNSAAPNMGIPMAMTASGFTQEVTSFWASKANIVESSAAQSVGRHTALRIEELHATGVDTDHEMQALLLVEQAYSANARVISVIDGLMKTLLEM